MKSMENNRVDYIVTFYFGKRRCFKNHADYEKNTYNFLNEQIKYIKKHRNEYHNVLFVINERTKYNEYDKRYIDEHCQGLDIKFIYRPNENLSYGAWQDAMNYLFEEGIEGDYAFLNEDDYIPIVKDFKQYWLKRMDTETLFVCGYYKIYEDKPYNNHPAISFGLMNYNLIKKKTVKFNLPKNTPNRLYSSGIQSQIRFLNRWNDSYFKDILDEHFIRFREPNLKFTIYGNEDGTEIIAPIPIK